MRVSTLAESMQLSSHAQTMSFMRRYEKTARWSSESPFAVLWLYCKREYAVLSLQDVFYDEMFCVGIAAAGMNRFTGSVNNFASVTPGFHRQHTFQTSQSNLIRGTVVHKTFKSLSSQMFRLCFLPCSPWNHLELLRQLKGCAPAAACQGLRWAFKMSV